MNSRLFLSCLIGLVTVFACPEGTAAVPYDSSCPQLLSVPQICAQNVDPGPSRDLRDSYNIDLTVKRVMLDVTVRDKKGRYKTNLKEKHFELYENGLQQNIDFFDQQANKPLSVVFLLDVSGSMGVGEKFLLAKTAIQYLASNLKSKDEYAVYLFADEGFETLASFRRNKSDLFQRLKNVRAYGKTALLDAIAFTPNFVQGARNNRKMIVILSDGVDNYSKTTLNTALEKMRELRYPLHSFAIKNLPGKFYPKDEYKEELLTECSLESGGEFFMVSDETVFKEACDKLLTAMRSSYAIGYKSNLKNDGKYRKITLKIKKKNLIAYYRKGYYP